MKRNLIVSEGAAGKRLDLFLSNELGITRSQVQKQLKLGYITVSGETQRAGYLIGTGDRVTANIPEAEVSANAAPDIPIIYEDDDILVIDKPAGLAVHHGSGTAGAATVADFARLHSTDPDPDRPGIIHRLDLDTSGLLIIAKTPDTKIMMQHQFARREVHKTYYALTYGHVNPPEAIINLPLDRDPAKPLRRAVVSGGRESVTRYLTLAKFDSYTLLEVKPETGRTHQIRVHLATMGHPVVGDRTYGPRERPLGLNRQFLHAAGLEFTLPSGQSITLNSPLPEDLALVLESLGASGII
jgi:23S rRNA pseudouridine1911/1915/1917 synthase